jgi:hypothetical protein
MSSLLQHHGCTTRQVPGKVELLMYLTRMEQDPLKCCDCGHVYVGGHVCERCGHAVSHVFTWSKEHKQSVRDLYLEWPVELAEKCRNGASPTCYVSNHWREVDCETVELAKPDGTLTRVPKLYRIFRRPVGMWGCWVEFRYNGSVHAPDLSVPIRVEKLPRDAERLTDEEAAKYWFS